MAEPIRILHVLGRLNRGGAETMILNLYRSIDRSKVQFDFMVHTIDRCDYEDEILEMGGKIYCIPRYLGENHFQYKKAWNMFLKSHTEYKIIHGHLRSTASIYMRIAKKHGRVTIAHSHSTASRGNKLEQFVKNILQLPIRYSADYLFACSDEAGRWLYGERATKGVNYMVIKNAIDIDKHVFDEVNRKKIRKELEVQNKFVVGHVGSFTYPKNHKFLVNVFHEVQKKNKNAILLLIGDGELRTQIQNQILDLGLKKKVILTGVVSNVNEYLQAMDMFVFPSIFEGLPVTVIEAQATGLPCIISDRITKEVNISTLVKSISLNASEELWAETIINYQSNVNRHDMYQDVVKAGYDIETSRLWLEEFYIREYQKKSCYEDMNHNYNSGRPEL